MRKLIIPAVAAFMMASPLALAQQSQDQSSSKPSQSDQTAAQSGSSASSGSQSGARSYSAVQSSLEKAGIENVKVLDAAYLVRATTKDGEQVSFVVEPPMTGASSGGSSGSSSASASGSGSSGSSSGPSAMRGSQDSIRQALSQAGFQNIQFVDASYLAQAQTKDGDQITMMIDPSMSGGGAQSAGSGGTSGSSSGGSSSPSGTTD